MGKSRFDKIRPITPPTFFNVSATYLLAVAVKDAIRAVVSDPNKASAESDVRAAYQIARLIRNAFAHAPFSPIWAIDPDCVNRASKSRTSSG